MAYRFESPPSIQWANRAFGFVLLDIGLALIIWLQTGAWIFIGGLCGLTGLLALVQREEASGLLFGLTMVTLASYLGFRWLGWLGALGVPAMVVLLLLLMILRRAKREEW